MESLTPHQRLLNQLSDIKFLIKEFQTANSHSYHISYHKIIQILRTSLITQFFESTTHLCSSVESIELVLNQLKQVSDNSIIMDWRDVILNMIGIGYPTLNELMEMKEKFDEKSVVKSFKWVSLGNYCQIRLWFEFEYDIEITCELKTIYFELFKKGETAFEYEHFLLALCKTVNPVDGFLLALELYSGMFQ